MPSSTSASGKIILSGEYAVIFGKRGIAFPSELKVNVTFVESQELASSTVEWKQKNIQKLWQDYALKIAGFIEKFSGIRGAFLIDNHLPLGKGMGSSTALVIAMTKAALGIDCESVARTIEHEVNPGNSGLDFAVIWHERSIIFQKGADPEFINLPEKLLQGMKLIDTGTPNETTPELVAWVKERTRAECPLPVLEEAENTIATVGILHEEGITGAGILPAEGNVLAAKNDKNHMQKAIAVIGACTERIVRGEDLRTVIKDHHRAQIALGVVPEKVQQLIAKIERGGGAAKVLGAGARTGGGGMILVLP